MRRQSAMGKEMGRKPSPYQSKFTHGWRAYRAASISTITTRTGGFIMSWAQFSLAATTSAAMASRIAVVSRIANSMELWWIANDGSVQGAYWYQGSTWQRYELA